MAYATDGPRYSARGRNRRAIPERTIFTRFIPPVEPEDMEGTWRSYFERWQEFTRGRIDPRMLDLVEPLKRFVPPALVLDKHF